MYNNIYCILGYICNNKLKMDLRLWEKNAYLAPHKIKEIKAKRVT